MMAPLDIHTLANYSAMRIVDSLAEGAAVCAFTALALRLSRRQSAAARFAICFFGLSAIAFFPVLRSLWGSSLLSQPGVPHHAALVVSESWALYVFWLWAMLAGFHLLGLGKSLLHLRTLRKSCTAVDLKTVPPLVQETLRKGAREVSLCTSDRVRVPTAVGLMKPAVILPQWVLEELSAAELNQVLLHEVAHLRRYDDWTNLAQQIVRAVFFFHPAVWWLEKRMAFEREMACDDAVIAETESPRAYAECLAHLAERSFVQRSIALAQAALGKLSETTQRVAQILDSNRPKGEAKIWKPALSAAAGVVLVCGVLISESPEWIAFQSAPVQVARSTPAARADTLALPVKMESYTSKAAPVSYAKFTPKRKAKRQENLQHLTALRAQQQTTDADLVHLTRATTPAPVIQTLLLVIDTGNPQAPAAVYEIQMWRVTVLHTRANPSAKAPSKI